MEGGHDHPRRDRDGIRVVDDAGKRAAVARVVIGALVAAAVAVVVVSAGTVLLLRHDDGARSEPREPASAPPAESAVTQPARPTLRRITPVDDAPAAQPSGRPDRMARAAAARRDAAPAPASAPVATTKPAPVDEQQRQVESMARDYVEGLRASGETRGLAAFPPAGTNPVKSGLIVPDDFQLPPGYIRHYQTTDDGQRLQAILMFSPDYQLVDANGNPMPQPDDGIVPPELAPPGLPIRKLEIPNAPSGGAAR